MEPTYYSHEVVDPSDGESLRVRQRREAARRAAHGEYAIDNAIGNEYVKPGTASTLSRQEAMASIRETLSRREQPDNMPELAIGLAGRANALLNIMDYMAAQNQASKVRELINDGNSNAKLIGKLQQVEAVRDQLYPLYTEGIDYIFPEGSDRDGKQRQALDSELGSRGDEARAERKALDTRLRGQAAIMGFRVSPPTKR